MGRSCYNPEFEEFYPNSSQLQDFQVVTSWLGTVLSPFLYTVNGGFREFPNQCFFISLLIASFNSLTDLGLSLCTIYFKKLHGKKSKYEKSGDQTFRIEKLVFKNNEQKLYDAFVWILFFKIHGIL